MLLAGDCQRPRQVGDAEGPDFESPESCGTVDPLQEAPGMHLIISREKPAAKGYLKNCLTTKHFGNTTTNYFTFWGHGGEPDHCFFKEVF